MMQMSVQGDNIFMLLSPRRMTGSGLAFTDQTP